MVRGYQCSLLEKPIIGGNIVIYNKKYEFGLPCFWHRTLKTIVISEVLRVSKVSFVMLMRRILDCT